MEISIFFSSLQEILCVSRSLGFDFGFPVGWPQNSRGFMIGRKSRNNFGGSWGYSLGGGGVNGNLFFSWEVKRRYTALWIVVSPLKKKKALTEVVGAEAPPYAFFTGDFTGKNEDRRSGGREMTNSTWQLRSSQGDYLLLWPEKWIHCI